MEEADGDSFADHVGEDFEQGDKAATLFDVEILEVGGDNPKEFFGPGEHFDDHLLVNVFIEDEVGHVERVSEK